MHPIVLKHVSPIPMQHHQERDVDDDCEHAKRHDPVSEGAVGSGRGTPCLINDGEEVHS